MKYSKNELLKYISENYSNLSKNKIVSETNLSWSYIQKIACLNGIKRNFNESSKSFRYSKMLSYDNISCYWIGFILADGHITKNSDRIQINLSIKDKNHILKIENHIGNVKKYENSNRISVVISDKPTILSISNSFSWTSNKTKNPITIPDFLDIDQLFSLIVGFIDGDGSISKKGNLRIKCDPTWKYILEKFYLILTGEEKKFELTSDNCSIIYISKYHLVKNIKEKSIQLNLPIMERKWNRISNNRILKSDKSSIVRSLMESGKNYQEIIKETGFSYSLIYKIKKKYYGSK